MTIRKILASLILLGFAAMHAWGSYKGYDPTISAIYAAGLIVGAVALLCNFSWARFFALGISATGVLGCGVMMFFSSYADKFVLGQTIVFGLLGLLLLGKRMAEKYEGQAGWGDGTLREQALSWAVIFNFAMLPMLMKYLGNPGEWVSDVVRVSTAATLATATIALFLLLKRRTAGLLLLGMSGFASIFLALGAVEGLQHLMEPSPKDSFICGTAAMWHHMHVTETAMVVAGVVPGALAAILAIVAFTGPMIRFLKERD